MPKDQRQRHLKDRQRGHEAARQRHRRDPAANAIPRDRDHFQKQWSRQIQGQRDQIGVLRIGKANMSKIRLA